MNASSPPREIIKWLQSLDLSLPVKNYKRDFVNGFVLADILSKYYPQDIQMHSFDNGTGTGARKNNWALLERVFVKYKLPITRDLINSINAGSSATLKATMILLTIVYGHLNKMKSQSADSVIVTSLNTAALSSTSRFINNYNRMEEETRILPVKENGLITINQVPLNQNQSFHSPKPVMHQVEDQDSVQAGKLPCTKILVSLFLPQAPHLSFYRSVYQPSVARELLGEKISKVPQLERIRESLTSSLALNNMSDFHGVCETFLPLLITFPVSSVVFKAAARVMWTFGDISASIWGGIEAYKKVASARDFGNLLKLVSLKTMDKIPFVASIVHAFIGDGVNEVECVRLFLEFKNMIGAEGSEYMFFFASFNALQLKPSHSQLTVFYLSECLTIINSYKSPLQRRSLLVAAQEDKNANSTLVSSAEIPGLEVSSILHILASILNAKVSLNLRILSDVLCSALRTFFKIVIHSGCPSHIRKSYLQVILHLLSVPDVLGLHNDAISCLHLMLKKFKGETLKDVIYMLAPLLKDMQSLATPYILALLSVPTLERKKMLESYMVYTLSWDVPFMFDPECMPLATQWDAFTVIMGVLRVTELQRGPFSVNALELVHTCLLCDPGLSKRCVDSLFTKMQDYLFAGLGVEESSQVAWDVFMVFMLKGTTQHIIQKFPVLLAVLIYTQTLENTKCKRRLMGRLRKLATLGTSLLEEQDRYYILKDMDQATLRIYQREAERILKLFRLEFPVISSQKIHEPQKTAQKPLLQV